MLYIAGVDCRSVRLRMEIFPKRYDEEWYFQRFTKPGDCIQALGCRDGFRNVTVQGGFSQALRYRAMFSKRNDAGTLAAEWRWFLTEGTNARFTIHDDRIEQHFVTQ